MAVQAEEEKNHMYPTLPNQKTDTNQSILNIGTISGLNSTHGLQNRPSNNRGKKGKQKIKWKNPMSEHLISIICQNKGYPLTAEFWKQEVADILGGCILVMRDDGKEFKENGMNHFKIIYIFI